MPLVLAGVGEENIIKKIGGTPEVKKHLENLGFVVGGSVTIVNTLGGNLIVNVKEDMMRIKEHHIYFLGISLIIRNHMLIIKDY